MVRLAPAFSRSRPKPISLSSERWSTSAFGLTVQGAFDAPGLSDAPGAVDGPVVEVRVVSRAALDELWGTPAGERLVDVRHPDGGAAMTVDRSQAGGLRVLADGYGDFAIAPAADTIWCAPEAVRDWQWQR